MNGYRDYQPAERHGSGFRSARERQELESDIRVTEWLLSENAEYCRANGLHPSIGEHYASIGYRIADDPAITAVTERHRSRERAELERAVEAGNRARRALHRLSDRRLTLQEELAETAQARIDELYET